MAVPTHLIPTYPSIDEVDQELSLIGLRASVVPGVDPDDFTPWGEALELSPEASRQIIAWCQTEWDRRQREGGA